MIAYILLFLASVFIAAVSQVMLKKAAMRNYNSVLEEYLNPLVIIAYILFFGTTLIGVMAYKVIPISLGPVLEATSYIYITVFGIVIFKEKFNLKQFFALALIILGIVIYTLWN
ncbi:multidrug ABC transporter [Pygmaiobacter massiliensis]|uniref:multidrug ABC transporter n=1 Tax=Pygmaiobacter massiliensis TaxID=1917873 RepID=UPI00289F43BF|nr:multidrug ABC transporter [Pygmaiobacter massiliensis]